MVTLLMLRHSFLSISLVVLVACACAAQTVRPARSDGSPSTAKWHPGHYVFVGQGAIRAEHILPHFRGVQKLYTWKLCEATPGHYDFSAVKADLALLQKHGKQLVLQMQYKAFGKGARAVPAWLEGPAYGGGVYRASSGSFDPVLWNAKVGQCMDALFAALGRELDDEPALEAVVLPETSPSVDFRRLPEQGVQPCTRQDYGEALKQRMTALRKACPHTVVIQYANFPREQLPELADYMKSIGVGMGGPDVYPGPSALADPLNGVYRLYAPLAGIVPLGAAVQSPDYSVANWKRTAAFNRGEDRNKAVVDPQDETPIPAREFLRLAQDKLKLNYLFWSASPKECFQNVTKMLAEPDLANDPSGGLNAHLPAKAFANTAGTTLD